MKEIKIRTGVSATNALQTLDDDCYKAAAEMMKDCGIDTIEITNENPLSVFVFINDEKRLAAKIAVDKIILSEDGVKLFCERDSDNDIPIQRSMCMPGTGVPVLQTVKRFIYAPIIKLLQTDIDSLNIMNRTKTALKNAGIDTMADLAMCSWRMMKRMPGISMKTANSLGKMLRSHGLDFMTDLSEYGFRPKDIVYHRYMTSDLSD